jgi:hypothetical protein
MAQQRSIHTAVLYGQRTLFTILLAVLYGAADLKTSLLSSSSAAQRLASRLRSAIHHSSWSLAPISGGGARGLPSSPCSLSSSPSSSIGSCCAAAVASA